MRLLGRLKFQSKRKVNIYEGRCYKIAEAASLFSGENI